MIRDVWDCLSLLFCSKSLKRNCSWSNKVSMSMSSKNRDRTLDILRGFAVLVMVPGNTAAWILFGEPYPDWFLVYGIFGSFVPALFILLSGMMVVYTVRIKGCGIGHFLKRAGALVFAEAVILSLLVWNVVPLIAAEILTLIAVGLPICFYFMRLPALLRWVVVIFIFILTPFLQSFLGYTPYPTEIHIFTGELSEDIYVYPTLAKGQKLVQSGPLQHWIVDGWFPIFPWLAFSLLGVNIALRRLGSGTFKSFGRPKVAIFGVLTLLVGVVLWKFDSTHLYMRSGYSEKIYPATIGYIVSTLGYIALMFWIADVGKSWRVMRPLQVFGESALSMYLLHYLVIGLVLRHLFEDVETALFLPTLFVFLGFLFIAAYGLRSLRRKVEVPGPLRLLLGI